MPRAHPPAPPTRAPIPGPARRHEPIHRAHPVPLRPLPHAPIASAPIPHAPDSRPAHVHPSPTHPPWPRHAPIVALFASVMQHIYSKVGMCRPPSINEFNADTCAHPSRPSHPASLIEPGRRCKPRPMNARSSWSTTSVRRGAHFGAAFRNWVGSQDGERAGKRAQGLVAAGTSRVSGGIWEHARMGSPCFGRVAGQGGGGRLSTWCMHGLAAAGTGGASGGFWSARVRGAHVFWRVAERPLEPAERALHTCAHNRRGLGACMWSRFLWRVAGQEAGGRESPWRAHAPAAAGGRGACGTYMGPRARDLGARPHGGVPVFGGVGGAGGGWWAGNAGVFETLAALNGRVVGIWWGGCTPLMAGAVHAENAQREIVVRRAVASDFYGDDRLSSWGRRRGSCDAGHTPPGQTEPLDCHPQSAQKLHEMPMDYIRDISRKSGLLRCLSIQERGETNGLPQLVDTLCEVEGRQCQDNLCLVRWVGVSYRLGLSSARDSLETVIGEVVCALCWGGRCLGTGRILPMNAEHCGKESDGLLLMGPTGGEQSYLVAIVRNKCDEQCIARLETSQWVSDFSDRVQPTEQNIDKTFILETPHTRRNILAFTLKTLSSVSTNIPVAVLVGALNFYPMLHYHIY
ncbi:hypothetical protein B0H14DRAFT_2558392 [Mycena olivaceomarginata]|nr:hypothetical protein B0H14DRAFT_2558392 [Mycena olivaceomarginata]